MSKRRPEPTVLRFGPLPDGVVSAVEQRSGVVVRPIDTIHDLAEAQTAAVLLAAPAETSGEAAVTLRHLRDSAPALVLIGVESGQAAPSGTGVTLFDATYQWPRANGELLAAVSLALKRRSSLTRSIVGTGARAIPPVAAAVLVVLIWQQICAQGLLPQYILPSPATVWGAITTQWQAFAQHTAITAAEALAGFLLGNAFGLSAAVLLYRFGWLRGASLPVLTGLQAVPIICLAPLLSLWLGSGVISKITMAAIVCLFPVILNGLAAFSAVDADLRELFRFHRSSYTRTLRELLIPASLPTLVAGLRISGGLAVVGAIVAEFTGADRGLGYLLLNATYRLETPILFAAILLSAALGVAFAQLPVLISRAVIGASSAQLQKSSGWRA